MLNVPVKSAMPPRLAVFDTETSGIDTETERIVTAFIGVLDTATGVFVEKHSWLLNPGIPIPEAASAVHGITTERAEREGTDPKMGVFEIAQRLDILDRQGLPVVIYNAPYDLTILDREMQRYYPGTRPTVPRVVFDPLVLDKGLDKYRKGSRKLVDVAAHYGVPVEANAHDAEADCLMAGRLMVKLLGHSRIAELSPLQIHSKTIPTARDQMDSLREYFRKRAAGASTQEERAEFNAKAASVRNDWPIIPRPETKES